jgi:hypothetical protein
MPCSDSSSSRHSSSIDFSKIKHLNRSTETGSTLGGICFPMGGIKNITHSIKAMAHAPEQTLSSLAIKIVRFIQSLVSLASFVLVILNIIHLSSSISTFTWATFFHLFFLSHPVYLALILSVLFIDLVITTIEYSRQHQLTQDLFYQGYSILSKEREFITDADKDAFLALLEKNQKKLSLELGPDLFNEYFNTLRSLHQENSTLEMTSQFLFMALHLSLFQFKKRHFLKNGSLNAPKINETLENFYPYSFNYLEVLLFLEEFPLGESFENPYLSFNNNLLLTDEAKNYLNNPMALEKNIVIKLYQDFKKKHDYTLSRVIFIAAFTLTSVISWLSFYVKELIGTIQILFNIIYAIAYFGDWGFYIKDAMDCRKKSMKILNDSNNSSCVVL